MAIRVTKLHVNTDAMKRGDPDIWVLRGPDGRLIAANEVRFATIPRPTLDAERKSAYIECDGFPVDLGGGRWEIRPRPELPEHLRILHRLSAQQRQRIIPRVSEQNPWGNPLAQALGLAISRYDGCGAADALGAKTQQTGHLDAHSEAMAFLDWWFSTPLGSAISTLSSALEALNA